MTNNICKIEGSINKYLESPIEYVSYSDRVYIFSHPQLDYIHQMAINVGDGLDIDMDANGYQRKFFYRVVDNEGFAVIEEIKWKQKQL